MMRFAGPWQALFRRGLALGTLFCALGAATASAESCPNDGFRTGPSAALPECRAWELVSPTLKAASVAINTSRFRVAQSESPGLPMAAVFNSLGGFADPQGSGVVFDYIAQRTLEPGTQGWTTHGITPRQIPLAFSQLNQGFDPLYVGDGDPALTKMVHRTITDVTPAPNLSGIPKLYLRTDLRSPGAGTYQMLMEPGFSITPLTDRPVTPLAGASTDLRKILFESVYPLTADAPRSTSAVKVYKSVDGTVQLVSVLPADEGGGPAANAIAGQGAATVTNNRHTPNLLSDDGSRAFFTVPQLGDAGRLYMRDDRGTDAAGDDVTVRIDRSERTVADAPQPATYWNAAADGSRVFFTSEEALTDDAPVVALDKLYVYDTTKPADEDNLTFISLDNERGDVESAVLGVMDVSLDGRSAYFIQPGQIVAGEPLIDDLGMYAWREGEGVRYIGEMLDDVADPKDHLPNVSLGLDDEWGASVSANGRYFLTTLRQPPWPGGADHGNCPGSGRIIGGKVGCKQLYLYDSETGEHPVCISCDPAGSAPSTPAFFSVRLNAGASAATTHRPRVMTADGSHVYFTTAEKLVATDVNGATDVYEYDVAAGEVRLISTGTNTEGTYFLEVTPDGKDVFIATREQLSPWDIDRDTDIYDARVGGGVAPPPATPTCTGDACQGDFAAPPGELIAGSSLLTVPERRSDRPRARRRARRRARACRRGKVRRRVDGRVRCVTRARARELARQRAGRGQHGRHGRGGAR